MNILRRSSIWASSLLLIGDLAQAGDAVDQVCHRPAEFFFDVHIGDVGIFQTVVEQAGHDGIGIHAQFGQNARHCHRMDEIGFTAAALLALMGFFRKIIGLRDLLHIGKRRMLLHFFQQCLQAIIGLIHKPNPIPITLCWIAAAAALKCGNR